MFGFLSKAQSPEAFKIYNNKGREMKFSKVLDELEDVDVVFFGELHNNSIGHWLELQILKSVYEKKKEILVGAEMFESDDQLVIDEYFEGRFKTNNFEKEVKLWDNYKTDYKPLLEFSKEQKLKFIATNIPRRYASVVSAKGFEGLEDLSPEAKKLIAPMPIKFDTLVPVYKEMLEMDMGHGPVNNVNFAKAQAIKDATMAYFITQNFKQGYTFLHFNGDFHSKLHSGIIWHLNMYHPGLKIITISCVESDKLDFDDKYKELADYIIVIPEDMAKTY